MNARKITFDNDISGSVGVEVAERVAGLVRVLDKLAAERGFPRDAVSDAVESHLDLTIPGTRKAALDTIPPARSLDLNFLALELAFRFRNRDCEPVAGGYRLGAGGRSPFIYVDGGRNPVGFIVSGVDELVGARAYPVEFPRDVVAFGLTRLTSKADRVRFLGELLGVYCDAIRVAGQDNGLLRRLFGTAGDLARLVTAALGDCRIDERSGTGDPAEASADGPDPREDVVSAHTSPSADVAGAHSVGVASVAGDDVCLPCDLTPEVGTGRGFYHLDFGTVTVDTAPDNETAMVRIWDREYRLISSCEIPKMYVRHLGWCS